MLTEIPSCYGPGLKLIGMKGAMRPGGDADWNALWLWAWFKLIGMKGFMYSHLLSLPFFYQTCKEIKIEFKLVAA